MAGNAGGAVWSTNGKEWELCANTAFDGAGINGAVYGDKKFILAGNNGKAAYAVVEK
jgi:hypothetical protein